jgi:protein SCO1/2
VIALAFIAALAAGAPALDARAGGPAIGLDEHVGAQLPLDLPFTTPEGKHVHLRDVFDGKHPVVLVLAYARCEMLCSVVLHGVGEAIKDTHLVAGRDYRPVIVSLDPSETPGEAGRRRGNLGYPATYLVGDDAAIHALANTLGFHYAWDERTKQYAHPVVIFVLTPDGHIAEYLRGVNFPALDGPLARAARGETTRSTASDLISCFHFDPSLRHYGPAIQLFLRLGAATILASVIALVTALVSWERRRRA